MTIACWSRITSLQTLEVATFAAEAAVDARLRHRVAGNEPLAEPSLDIVNFLGREVRWLLVGHAGKVCGASIERQETGLQRLARLKESFCVRFGRHADPVGREDEEPTRKQQDVDAAPENNGGELSALMR